jgi:hypothetical protein
MTLENIENKIQSYTPFRINLEKIETLVFGN